MGLNEPLKPAPQGFATDYQVRTTMQRTVAYNNFAPFRAIIYQASFSFYPFPPYYEARSLFYEADSLNDQE